MNLNGNFFEHRHYENMVFQRNCLWTGVVMYKSFTVHSRYALYLIISFCANNIQLIIIKLVVTIFMILRFYNIWQNLCIRICIMIWSSWRTSISIYNVYFCLTRYSWSQDFKRKFNQIYLVLDCQQECVRFRLIIPL